MKLDDFFKLNRIMLLDGGTGSLLIEKGLKTGEPPELWNINQADEIANLAKIYFYAGSDAVYTNSFGGSKFKLSSYGMGNRITEINYSAAKIAVGQKPEAKFVFGSVGPSGKMLEPFGDVSEPEMILSFTDQIKALVNGGVDAIVFETFTDLNEIKCAILALKEFSTLPFITSMTFDKNPAGYRTMMGVSIPEAADELLNLGAYAIGSNCGNGIENMIEIGNEFRNISTEIKIILKANAGMPKYTNGKIEYSESPEYFARHTKALFKINPSFVGGCCGTTPEHIKVLRNAINNHYGIKQ